MINAVLAFLPKPLLFWGSLFLVLLVGIQTARVSSLTKENAQYEVAVEQCKKTNDANKEVVEFLQLQNDQCLADRREDETRLANQVAAWNAEKALLIEKAEDIEIRNVEVYRDPDCTELALLNVTDVCPDFVNRMRERAESYNRIRND